MATIAPMGLGCWDRCSSNLTHCSVPRGHRWRQDERWGALKLATDYAAMRLWPPSDDWQAMSVDPKLAEEVFWCRLLIWYSIMRQRFGKKQCRNKCVRSSSEGLVGTWNHTSISDSLGAGCYSNHRCYSKRGGGTGNLLETSWRIMGHRKGGRAKPQLPKVPGSDGTKSPLAVRSSRVLNHG